MRARFAVLTAVLATVPATMLVLGLASRHFWAFDLCAHATAQCLWCLLLAAVALAVTRHFRLLLGVLPFVLLAVYRTWPLFVGGTTVAVATDRPLLHLTTVNLLFDNDDHAAVRQQIRSRPCDLLLVQELTTVWQRELRELECELPHTCLFPDQIFGIGLYSRYPLRSAKVVPLGFEWAPAIAAVVDTPQGPLSVLAVHPPRPGYTPATGPRMTGERDTALAALPALLATLPPPRVVAGDCNATRWSGAFAAMLAATGLRDTADGQGWQPTWPAALPSLLRIPIDQVLVSADLAVADRAVGGATGSDHLPVFVSLQLPAR